MLSLQLVVGCTAVVVVAIPEVSFVYEVQLPVNDSLACQGHVWRNRELQLVARYLWCSDHQLGFSYCYQVQFAIMRSRNTPSYHYWTSSLMDSSLDAPFVINHLFPSPNSHSSIGYMKQKPALIRPMDHTQGPQIKNKNVALTTMTNVIVHVDLIIWYA